MSEGMSHDEAVAAANKPLPFHILTDDKASGGRVGMLWGGGVIKTIIQNLAKMRGVTPSEYLKVTNWKALPKLAKDIMSKADFEYMKRGRIDMFKNWIDMAKTRLESLKNIREGIKTPAKPIYEHLKKIVDKESVVPGNVTQQQILQAEQVLKNILTKGRKLHASGGVAGMLGE